MIESIDSSHSVTPEASIGKTVQEREVGVSLGEQVVGPDGKTWQVMAVNSDTGTLGIAPLGGTRAEVVTIPVSEANAVSELPAPEAPTEPESFAQPSSEPAPGLVSAEAVATPEPTTVIEGTMDVEHISEPLADEPPVEPAEAATIHEPSTPGPITDEPATPETPVSEPVPEPTATPEVDPPTVSNDSSENDLAWSGTDGMVNRLDQIIDERFGPRIDSLQDRWDQRLEKIDQRFADWEQRFAELEPHQESHHDEPKDDYDLFADDVRRGFSGNFLEWDQQRNQPSITDELEIQPEDDPPDENGNSAPGRLRATWDRIVAEAAGRYANTKDRIGGAYNGAVDSIAGKYSDTVGGVANAYNNAKDSVTDSYAGTLYRFSTGEGISRLEQGNTRRGRLIRRGLGAVTLMAAGAGLYYLGSKGFHHGGGGGGGIKEHLPQGGSGNGVKEHLTTHSGSTGAASGAGGGGAVEHVKPSVNLNVHPWTLAHDLSPGKETQTMTNAMNRYSHEIGQQVNFVGSGKNTEIQVAGQIINPSQMRHLNGIMANTPR